MRHLVDARLSPKAAGAGGETSAGTNTAMAAFSMNQNSALCLPLVTESQKLVWVHSNQINSQLDGAGELLKAFDRSPYLTKKETAALAQRCSLPADQVKVWFMVQRLRYGISWDYEDIREVQRKFKSSQRKAQGEQDLQNTVGEVVREEIRKKKKKKKRKEKECDGKEEGKVRKSNERGMMGKNLRVRKMEQDQLKNKVRERKVKDDERNACRKWKRMEITHPTVGKRRMTQGDDGMMERGGEVRSLDQVESEGQKSIQSDTTNKFMYVNVYPAEQCELFSQLQLSDDQTEVLERAEVAPPATNCSTGMITGFEGTPATEIRIEGDGHAEFVSDVDKLRELLNISPAVNTSSTLNPQQASQTDASTIHKPTRFKTRSYSQLRMMRAAFCHCQYPNREDFDYLAPAIDLPRRFLVKWFSDTRYCVKKRKPSWVNEEQYKQMLSNISYWQHVEMCKVRSSANRKRCSARENTQKCEGSTTV